LYQQLTAIIAPVAVCALLGYGWARAGWPFDRDFVTRMIMNFGAPALVIDGIGGLQAETPKFLLALALAFVVLLVCALAGYATLRAAKQPVRSFLLPVTYGNVGNLGLPLCYFAFGAEGLGLAVGFYLAGSLSHFIFGPLLLGREPAWQTLFKTPIIYAAVAGLAIMTFRIPAPPWLDNTVDLVAGMAIPLMLLALGHALGTFGVQRLRASALVAALRMGLGFAAGVALVQVLQLDGVLRGVVLIESAMPVAIFNFLLAARYDRDPDAVAGAIVISTVVSFATMPALLLYALPGQGSGAGG
jgi:predicted permease